MCIYVTGDYRCVVREDVVETGGDVLVRGGVVGVVGVSGWYVEIYYVELSVFGEMNLNVLNFCCL